MEKEIKVKICGLRSIETARVAVENGAALLGLVFYPPSPRYLSPEAAGELVAGLDQMPGRPGLVGLFVNAPLTQLAQAARDWRLDYLQLSGDETPEQVAQAVTIRPVLKALRLPARISAQEALAQAARYGELDRVTLLLDTHRDGMYGGTGQTGDWEAARAVAARYPTVLAGGLTPENVAQAVTVVHPWGVDVSSGVERDGQPGQKDPEKIRRFCRAALSAQFI